MYVKDVVLWHTRQCGTMVDVSQVMIAHTITCQIHTSRHTTHLRNELSSLQKFFCFSDFRIWLLNGQNEIMLVEDLENFQFWIVFWCFRDPSICFHCTILCRNEKFTKTFVKNLVRDPPSECTTREKEKDRDTFFFKKNDFDTFFAKKKSKNALLVGHRDGVPCWPVSRVSI